MTVTKATFTPQQGESISIDYGHIKKSAAIIRAINHKLRQEILELLNENKRMTVTEIYVKLRLEQSVASQHLAILRTAGFVITERDGKNIYYTVNYTRLEEVNKFVENLTAK